MHSSTNVLQWIKPSFVSLLLQRKCSSTVQFAVCSSDIVKAFVIFLSPKSNRVPFQLLRHWQLGLQLVYVFRVESQKSKSQLEVNPRNFDFKLLGLVIISLVHKSLQRGESYLYHTQEQLTNEKRNVNRLHSEQVFRCCSDLLLCSPFPQLLWKYAISGTCKT